MKIVVIGNGFDLACGLPTSYNDFFDYRVQQKKYEFDQIAMLVNFTVKSNALKFYNEYRKDDAIVNGQRISGKKLEHRLIDAINEDFINASDMYNKHLDNLMLNGINFWDIFFWVTKNNFTNKDWSDVEDKISS